MKANKKRKQNLCGVFFLLALIVLTLLPHKSEAQQKDLGEVNILTAVSNMAFSALWVAEQLKYFEQEGVRAKITPAGGGAPCQNAVVGRSAQLLRLEFRRTRSGANRRSAFDRNSSA
ncbi:MAG: hypothetical protein E6J73_08510 [Deltaproteobacteria bacterium]|nr:MAG: hypothetical protein E6J73_08510 [Deltaproteobacteria bacterium]